MTEKITDENGFCVGNTHLDINSEKVILDGKPISEWLNTAIAKKVAQLGDDSMDTADSKYITIGNKKHSNITVTDEDGSVVAVITPNEIVERKGCKVIYDVGERAKQMKIENDNAIMEITENGITITQKHPNTIKKPKSDAKLMIDGKPLAEIIDDLRAAIANIGVQIVALQASEAAGHASDAIQRTADDKDVHPYHYKDSGEDHDEHK